MSPSSALYSSPVLTVDDAIHGWSPTGEDDVEVNVSKDMCLTAISPITSSSSFLSPVCPPLNSAPPKTCSPQFQTTPLASLTGASRPSIAVSSDRRAQRNRSRDPSWIPRPRNAFIIFRCEYSREHAQGSQELQNDPDSTACVKTLSKRAADAWKRLPSSEKQRYKVLADRERKEHARLYPHYRFRPIKRQASRTRKGSNERSRSPKQTSMEGRPVPSVHLPSVLAAAPENQRSSPFEQAEMSESMQPATVAPLPEQLAYPVDQTWADSEMPLGADYSDTILIYPSPEATLPSDSPTSPAVELYSPFHISAANIPHGASRCNDVAFGPDPDHQGLEHAQALEAYAIGLYNYELLSSSPFVEK